LTVEIATLQGKDFSATNALWNFTKGIILREVGYPENFKRLLERNLNCCFAAGQNYKLLVGTLLAGQESRRGYYII
jgi:hypothetical protein